MHHPPLKTPIAYYGGKQKLAHKILPLIPKHSVFVECMAGGLAVFFAKGTPQVSAVAHYREVVNDINGDLANLYHVMRNETLREALIEKLEWTPWSRETWLEFREQPRTSCMVESALRYFTVLSLSFANVYGKSLGFSVFGSSEAAKWVARRERLKAMRDRMDAVHIENDDALNVIRRWDSPQTFFYIDPPYPGADQGHYGGYSVEDYRKLVDLLSTVKGSFLLSNYPQADVKKPASWEKFEFSAHCFAAARTGHDRTALRDEKHENRSRTEVVWRKFSSVPRPEILKLYETPAFQKFAPHDWEEKF